MSQMTPMKRGWKGNEEIEWRFWEWAEAGLEESAAEKPADGHNADSGTNECKRSIQPQRAQRSRVATVEFLSTDVADDTDEDCKKEGNEEIEWKFWEWAAVGLEESAAEKPADGHNADSGTNECKRSI